MNNEETVQQEQQEQEQQQEERLFTQEEVDEIISKRVARLKKNQPSDEELTAYREWKSSQKPEKDTTRDELDNALADAEMVRRENYLLRKGYDPEEVDYLVYRISKAMDGDTDFEEAAEEYFKKHKAKNPVRLDTGARLNSGAKAKTANEAMNDIIRNSRK